MTKYRGLFFGLACSLIFSGCATQEKKETTYDKENIRQVVRMHLGEIRPCYEEAIERRPGAEGKVVMQWTIDKEGRATGIGVKQADDKAAGVTECLGLKIGTWVFPKPEDGVVDVVYPFVFSENERYK